MVLQPSVPSHVMLDSCEFSFLYFATKLIHIFDIIYSKDLSSHDQLCRNITVHLFLEIFHGKVVVQFFCNRVY